MLFLGAPHNACPIQLTQDIMNSKSWTIALSVLCIGAVAAFASPAASAESSTVPTLEASEQTPAKEYSGLVVDATTGEPLIGAFVYIKGTTIGTTTDENGAFRISVPDGTEPILVFSFISYQDVELRPTTTSCILV